MTGIAESPVFILTEPSISFLVGGGNSPRTYLALCTLDETEQIKVVTVHRGKMAILSQKRRLSILLVHKNPENCSHVTKKTLFLNQKSILDPVNGY